MVRDPERTLTATERALIRAEEGVDDGTIRRYPCVREASRMRIERAAKKHGIVLPGVQKCDDSQEPTARNARRRRA